ncbi:DUF5677 domain-containing protein [Kitasatospora sp. NPDC127111]|uniref:DUF5677 domain-containing protein n=1 Tax=Kitasatospora sp. NPDC127111 TaxID=3345363 RepID=UPI003633C0B7
MEHDDSEFLAISARRFNRLVSEGAATAEEFDGVAEFRATISALPSIAPDRHAWAARCSSVRTDRRRSTGASVRRSVLRHYGRALGSFDRALGAAEFVNGALIEAVRDWMDEQGGTGPEALLGIERFPSGVLLKSLVLTGLHSQMVQLGAEVAHLLRGGHPEGATSRVRTLYETVLKTVLICSDQSPGGYELAERYYVSSLVEANGKERLANGPIDEDARELRDAAVAAWGPQFFSTEHNWAAPATGDPLKKRVTFSDIEECLGAGPVSHIYKEANRDVHAGPTKVINAADFSVPYLYDSRPAFDVGATGRAGHAAAFLIAEGTLEVLRRVTSDLRQWDAALAASEFLRLVSAAGTEFHRAGTAGRGLPRPEPA